MTLDEFDTILDEPYVWPGGYPRHLVTSDGACLCYQCGRDNREDIESAIEDGRSDGWLVETAAVNWEDPDLLCDNCGERIESAYAEDKS